MLHIVCFKTWKCSWTLRGDYQLWAYCQHFRGEEQPTGVSAGLLHRTHVGERQAAGEMPGERERPPAAVHYRLLSCRRGPADTRQERLQTGGAAVVRGYCEGQSDSRQYVYTVLSDRLAQRRQVPVPRRRQVSTSESVSRKVARIWFRNSRQLV